MMGRHHRPVPGAPRHRRRLIPLLLVTVLLGLQTVLGHPAAAQSFSDCAHPPALERPGDGAVGTIDYPQGNGFGGSLYTQYSYAGFVWHTYDQKSGPICGDPFAEFTTWVGNRVFDVAKLIVGTVNSLHYMLYQGQGVFGLDDIVKKGSNALYEGAAIPYIGLGLLLVAVVMFMLAMKGDLAGVSKSTARVLVGLGIMAATALTPLAYTTLTDSLLVNGVAELEANIYENTVDEDVVYRDVLPEMLHRTVIVENWQIGEFGSTGTDYVTKMTPELLDAQAWTWTDVASGRDGDDEAEQQKHDKFKRIAEDVKQNANYAAFSGDGSSRLGASVFALAEATCFAVFQLLCKIAILLAQIIFRLGILAGPVLGLLMFVPGVARTVARGILGILAQGLILTVAALTHAMILGWIIDSQAFGGRVGKLILMGVITALLWKIIRPLRRLKAMASAAVGIATPSRHEQRLEDLLHRRNRNKKGWLRRIFRPSTPPDWGKGKGIPQHPPWPAPPRPETKPDHDADERSTVLVHRNSREYDNGFDYDFDDADGERRDTRTSGPTGDYIDGEWWESHTPDPRRRPELARARAGLPPGTGDRTEGSGDGRGRHDGTGGGSGGGATARAEGATDSPVIPSRDKWLDAERGDASDARLAGSKTEGGKTVFTVYVPSTDRVETNVDWSTESRPESKEDD